MVKHKNNTKQSKASLDRVKERRTRLATEALGWYGAIAIVVAYGLVTFNIVSVHQTIYLILNFTGSIGILTVATAKHVKQSMLINAFWAFMAAVALVRILLQR